MPKATTLSSLSWALALILVFIHYPFGSPQNISIEEFIFESLSEDTEGDSTLMSSDEAAASIMNGENEQNERNAKSKKKKYSKKDSKKERGKSYSDQKVNRKSNVKNKKSKKHGSKTSKKRNKHVGRDPSENKGCLSRLPSKHQTCLDEFEDLTDDAYIVNDNFHLALIQETDMTVSCDDIVDLEEIILTYFYDNYDSLPMCALVVDAATSSLADPDSPGMKIDAIAFQMEITYVIIDEEDWTRSNKKCNGSKVASCCPTAINGKCTCCCKKCKSSKRKKLFDLLGLDLNYVIDIYTNFQPMRTRYITEGQSTGDVAMCSLHRYMQDVFEVPFQCHVYDSYNCFENEEDINDVVCHE